MLTEWRKSVFRRSGVAFRGENLWSPHEGRHFGLGVRGRDMRMQPGRRPERKDGKAAKKNIVNENNIKDFLKS